MSWLLDSLLFIALHFVLYTLVLRHVRSFSSERVIFLYQVLSFLALPIVLLTLLPQDPEPFPAMAAALSLHAIYSLSFLELWSLSEGSYSLRMVDRVERLGVMPADADVSDLERIGASKKAVRLGSLAGLGLVRQEQGRYTLTNFGRIAAAPLRLLAWLANIGDRIG
jgi:hypothetical protein